MPSLLCPLSDSLLSDCVAAPSRLDSTTIVSVAATSETEGSCLLLRRRFPSASLGHVLTLRGEFGPAMTARLRRAVAAFPSGSQSLTLDLRHVTRLDDSCSCVLMQTRWDHVSPGPVIWPLSPVDAVREIFGRRSPGTEPLLGYTPSLAPSVSAALLAEMR